jgi:hypothetical protein
MARVIRDTEYEVWQRARATSLMSVRVWRLVAGAPQGLFAYAGSIDAVVLGAVMQHVRRLTAAVPGDWRVEVIGAGLEGGLLQAVKNDLGALRASGLRPRLALAARRRPPLRVPLGEWPLRRAPRGTLLH